MTSDTKDVRACGIKDTLEIILITYNRKPFLKKTLDSILDTKSPVRELSVTVLDNCSTDGTGELIEEYAAKFPNIKHIRHAKNIGGNANIARAFEIAQKKYFWVLADDDAYDFSAWDEAENALREDYDLIIVNHEGIHNRKVPQQLQRRVTFLPACIHKTALIDNFTMLNIYDNIHNWFPHLAAVYAVVNKGGRVYNVSKNIVLGRNSHKTLGICDLETNLNPSQANMFFEVGYLSSLEMIKDKKLRALAVENYAMGQSFFSAVFDNFKKNFVDMHAYPGNFTSLYSSLNLSQKLRYIAAILLSGLSYIIKYPKYALRKKMTEKHKINKNDNP